MTYRCAGAENVSAEAGPVTDTIPHERIGAATLARSAPADGDQSWRPPARRKAPQSADRSLSPHEDKVHFHWHRLTRRCCTDCGSDIRGNTEA